MATSQIKRCELAIEAYQKNLFDTLVISGGAVKNQYTESKEMAKFIQQKCSMPIICETQARNTYENFKNSSRITQDVPILILTGSLHAKRSCAIAKEFYSNYSAYTYPDHKLRHIIREIASRYIYIKIELLKKAGKY
ncbi:YdcF family protein [Faecalitalea cylindroides]|uniref:YdcF family protein n=2 Tax=Faecalitalea cylindroides TaxID=39483 RepID=A0AAW6FN16_9FIRM|nr:YdcF family protein [Faecalitalea cylindroides]MBM6652224.1 YdcF family protein [Faecalitalea cylindroides]MDB7949310.1 YdcF family protein [Faecalitalea cylindroides]MDB7951249.1 YdcF family protein [Faecalitalea cylindroides]MDC0827101.1 YdcF family protein [Faecalitalea cylindroides]